MFTGIVEELGSVAAIEQLAQDAARFTLHGPLVVTDARHGDSIAVNGVCLTVVDVKDGSFTADVMSETLKRSSLGALDVGSPVNLERAVTLNARMGGHLVQGHVDGVGYIASIEPAEHWTIVRITCPREIATYVVEKGSITVDGVSLTVVDVSEESFSISLIPTTLALTTLGKKSTGEPVNLEVDVIAKYVEKLMRRND